MGDPKYARIAFDMVSLRAVEQRRYLVRASTSGPSGIVDPHGHVLVSTFPDTQAVLAGPIGRSREITPYCWLGDAFAGACAVAVVLSLVGHAVGVRGRQ